MNRENDNDAGSGDMIPDPIEPGIPVAEGGPYDPNAVWTHPDLGAYYIDSEAHAEFSHATDWPLLNGKVQKKDWGYPGSRWNPSLSYPD